MYTCTSLFTFKRNVFPLFLERMLLGDHTQFQTKKKSLKFSRFEHAETSFYLFVVAHGPQGSCDLHIDKHEPKGNHK